MEYLARIGWLIHTQLFLDKQKSPLGFCGERHEGALSFIQRMLILQRHKDSFTLIYEDQGY